MENTNETTFSYEYSAGNAKEAEAILGKYVPQEKSSLEKMKEIDAAVNKKATASAILIGVLGALVLGTGMSMVMEAGANFLGLGILIGIIGLGICGYAFLHYQSKLKKERAKVADEIVRLSKEV